MEIPRYKKEEYLKELQGIIEKLQEAQKIGIEVTKTYEAIMHLKETVESLADVKLNKEDDSKIKLSLNSFDYKYLLSEIIEEMPIELRSFIEKDATIPNWLKKATNENKGITKKVINNLEHIMSKNYEQVLQECPELYKYLPLEEKKNNLELAQIATSKSRDLLEYVPLELIDKNKSEFELLFLLKGISLENFSESITLLKPEEIYKTKENDYNFSYSFDKMPEEMQMKNSERIAEIVNQTGDIEGTCSKWQVQNSELVAKAIINDYGKLKYTSSEWQVQNSKLVANIIRKDCTYLKYTSPEWQVQNSELIADKIREYNSFLQYTSAEWQVQNSELVADVIREYDIYLKFTSPEWQVQNSELVANIITKWRFYLQYTSPEWQVQNSEFVASIIKRNYLYLEYTSAEWQKNNKTLVLSIIFNYPEYAKYNKLSIDKTKEVNKDDSDKEKDDNIRKQRYDIDKPLNLEKISELFPPKVEEFIKYLREDIQCLVKSIENIEYGELDYTQKIIESLREEQDNGSKHILTLINIGKLGREIFTQEAKESLVKEVEKDIEDSIKFIGENADKATSYEYREALKKVQSAKQIEIFNNEELYKKYLTELSKLSAEIEYYIKKNFRQEEDTRTNKRDKNSTNSLSLMPIKKKNIFERIIEKIFRKRQNSVQNQSNSDTSKETGTDIRTRLKAEIESNPPEDKGIKEIGYDRENETR